MCVFRRLSESLVAFRDFLCVDAEPTPTSAEPAEGPADTAGVQPPPQADLAASNAGDNATDADGDTSGAGGMHAHVATMALTIILAALAVML